MVLVPLLEMVDFAGDAGWDGLAGLVRAGFLSLSAFLALAFFILTGFLAAGDLPLLRRASCLHGLRLVCAATLRGMYIGILLVFVSGLVSLPFFSGNGEPLPVIPVSD